MACSMLLIASWCALQAYTEYNAAYQNLNGRTVFITKNQTPDEFTFENYTIEFLTSLHDSNHFLYFNTKCWEIKSKELSYAGNASKWSRDTKLLFNLFKHFINFIFGWHKFFHEKMFHYLVKEFLTKIF